MSEHKLSRRQVIQSGVAGAGALPPPRSCPE